MNEEHSRVPPVDDAGPGAARGPGAGASHVIEADARPLAPLDEARRAFERDYLVRILGITRGNVTHAARLAGRNRTEFYRLLERHALEPSIFKQAG